MRLRREAWRGDRSKQTAAVRCPGKVRGAPGDTATRMPERRAPEMRTSNVLTIRPEGDPQGRVHIVFRSRPNYSLCGVRLVDKWTPAGDDPSSDRVCAKCRESYVRQAEEEEARWAAWQAGEARPGRPPEDEESGP